MTQALCGLLRWAGGEVVCSDVHAALGLSLRSVAVTGKTCVGQWAEHGADVFLAEGLRPFGLHVRALHPPSAAVGLAEHEPYVDHFRDSYTPLIRRALAHNQPVLAWQGWAGDDGGVRWGVVTRECAGDLGFAGVTRGDEASTVLVKPPIQCYVVEDVSPQSPDTSALWQCAMTRSDVFARDAVGRANFVSGPAATDAWKASLLDGGRCPACGSASAFCHVRHARAMAADRMAAIDFLTRNRPGVEPTLHPKIDALITACRETCETLNALCDAQDATPDALSVVEQRDREVAELISSLIKTM